jgi:ABC-type polysaccharide/polyol phosphate transport system ATPase subunit
VTRGASPYSLLALLGLREHHTVLDIGGGSLRGGVRLLSQLAAGNYHATGPAEHLGEEQLSQEIGRDLIAVKRPVFRDDADFTLTAFGRTFDYLLADSIFSGASQQQIVRCLSQARLVMKPHSVFAATLDVCRPESGEADEIATGDAGPATGTVCATLDQLTALAAEQGLDCRRISWPHPGGQTWVIFTRPWWPGTLPAALDPAAAPGLTHSEPSLEAAPARPSPAQGPNGPREREDGVQAATTLVARPSAVIAARAPADIAETDRDLRILVEGVGVRYRAPIGPSLSLKEYVIRRIKGQPGERGFWALNGVGLTIRRGEVVGIIGHNGAGKSTLLKAISRVLRPTLGRIVVRGRVTPLLELGAGFHAEQTGRENVYLNATLLGHSRREVEAAIGGIVDFAELHEFLDAPVRTYSTGMIARLGFAIATAWSPDILILDEILGVGDGAFQQKCAQRIAEMRERASTVLLVSHSMQSIQKMCHRVIWIDHGTVKADGPTAEVIAHYQRQ